jgi:hypothetical protein
LEVQARSNQLRQRFGSPTVGDDAKMLWLFPQVERGVYFMATKEAAYLIIDRWK